MTASAAVTAAASAAAEQQQSQEAAAIATADTVSGQQSREFFKNLLNKLLRVKLSDGRVLVGQFLCTDRDANIILGSCAEYVPTSGGNPDDVKDDDDEDDEDLDACMRDSVEPRILGLAMVKGKHIVSMHYDDISATNSIAAPKNSPQLAKRTSDGAGVSNEPTTVSSQQEPPPSEQMDKLYL